MKDDVTALVQQPQPRDVTLPVSAAGAAARLVGCGHEHAEVCGQSSHRSGRPSRDASTLGVGDVLRVRSKRRPRRRSSPAVELGALTHYQNLRRVVPDITGAKV